MPESQNIESKHKPDIKKKDCGFKTVLYNAAQVNEEGGAIGGAIGGAMGGQIGGQIGGQYGVIGGVIR